MMVLQYDQLDNHDIVAIHLFGTGAPDFQNYHDIANFSAADVDGKFHFVLFCFFICFCFGLSVFCSCLCYSLQISKLP
jgi:hypothetical protein